MACWLFLLVAFSPPTEIEERSKSLCPQTLG
jgi:hypothetical protein